MPHGGRGTTQTLAYARAASGVAVPPMGNVRRTTFYFRVLGRGATNWSFKKVVRVPGGNTGR